MVSLDCRLQLLPQGMSSQSEGAHNSRRRLLSTKAPEPLEERMPGFRFHPTEEELVGYYLANMVDGRHRRQILRVIRLIDFYQFDPWELPAMAALGETEWYFFCARDRKYQKGCRANRVSFSGYWKATGSERAVTSSNHTVIGAKKTLVFYCGRAPNGTKSNWIMNEYRRVPDTGPLQANNSVLPFSLPAGDSKPHKSPASVYQQEVALCRVYKKSLPRSHLPAPLEHEEDPSPAVDQHIMDNIAEVGEETRNSYISDKNDCGRRSTKGEGRFPRHLNPNHHQQAQLHPRLISSNRRQVKWSMSELPKSELPCVLDELVVLQQQSLPLESRSCNLAAAFGHLQDPANTVHPTTPVASPQPSWLSSFMSPSVSEPPPPLALSPLGEMMSLPASASHLHPAAALLSWLFEDCE